MKVKEYWIAGDERPALTMISDKALVLDMGANYEALGRGKLTQVSTDIITCDRTIVRLKQIGE